MFSVACAADPTVIDVGTTCVKYGYCARDLRERTLSGGQHGPCTLEMMIDTTAPGTPLHEAQIYLAMTQPSTEIEIHAAGTPV